MAENSDDKRKSKVHCSDESEVSFEMSIAGKLNANLQWTQKRYFYAILTLFFQ